LALQLDAEDLIKSAFRLEVTSPGLDWPLQSEADSVVIRMSGLKSSLWTAPARKEEISGL